MEVKPLDIKCIFIFRGWKVVVSMLLVQAFSTGTQLLSKVVLNNGTFIFALMTYRHIIAAICVVPFALYFERLAITKLNWKIWIWIFLNALVGITLSMGLYYYGLRDTAATYAVNFLNLVPIVTFVISIIIRAEPLGLKSRWGQLKMPGALICVAGTLITGLYYGKSFYISNHHSSHFEAAGKKVKTNYGVGTGMLVGGCLSYALWYNLQVQLIKVFPLKYWTTLLTCILASIQSVVIGVIINRSKNAWRLGWDLELLTIVYSGALSTSTTFCLVSFVVALRGPTYPAMFNPLTLIFVAILEGLILGDAISVGTVLGTILITIGLYAFLWGQTKQMKKLLSQGNLPATDVESDITESATIQPARVIMKSEQVMGFNKVDSSEQISTENKAVNAPTN